MRSCGSSSSPTAHITFCTLTEVFRPQILIMALPSLPRDGRIVVPAIHLFARAENKPRVAAQGRHRSRQHVGVAKPVVTTGNKRPAWATRCYTRRLRSTRVRDDRV